jgi:hypothetical protein
MSQRRSFGDGKEGGVVCLDQEGGLLMISDTQDLVAKMFGRYLTSLQRPRAIPAQSIE